MSHPLHEQTFTTLILEGCAALDQIDQDGGVIDKDGALLPDPIERNRDN